MARVPEYIVYSQHAVVRGHPFCTSLAIFIDNCLNIRYCWPEQVQLQRMQSYHQTLYESADHRQLVGQA